MFQVYSPKFPALYLGQIAAVDVRPRDHIVHRVQTLLLRRERFQRVRVELVFHAVHHSDEIEYTGCYYIVHVADSRNLDRPEITFKLCV